MIDSFLITSRETLEAGLVVGIVLAYLNKTNNRNYKKTVYYAIAFGILASILAAFAFTFFAGEFKGASEQIFEGVTMLIGAFLLTTMVLWMMQQRYISKAIESKVQVHLTNPVSWISNLGIFMVIFIAIIREGVETVVFLNALNYQSGISFLGGALGVIAAVAVGYIFFISTKKINLKKLFNVSSILLILFAAGLVLHGTHEFVESGILPGIISPLFNIGHILSDESAVGSFLKGLFGYVSDPSLIEVMAYFTYLGIILILYMKIKNSRKAIEHKIHLDKLKVK
ncbi:MAG: FTR1 family protein [Nanoarchaeota archaeon]